MNDRFSVFHRKIIVGTHGFSIRYTILKWVIYTCTWIKSYEVFAVIHFAWILIQYSLSNLIYSESLKNMALKETLQLNTIQLWVLKRKYWWHLLLEKCKFKKKNLEQSLKVIFLWILNITTPCQSRLTIDCNVSYYVTDTLVRQVRKRSVCVNSNY